MTPIDTNASHEQTMRLAVGEKMHSSSTNKQTVTSTNKRRSFQHMNEQTMTLMWSRGYAE